MPKSLVSFWKKKFEQNVSRDRKNQCELRQLGWNVLVLWECQIMRDPEKLVKLLLKKLPLQLKDSRIKNIPHQGAAPRLLSQYSIPEKKELLKIAEKRADYSRIKKHRDQIS